MNYVEDNFEDKCIRLISASVFQWSFYWQNRCRYSREPSSEGGRTKALGLLNIPGNQPPRWHCPGPFSCCSQHGTGDSTCITFSLKFMQPSKIQCNILRLHRKMIFFSLSLIRGIFPVAAWKETYLLVRIARFPPWVRPCRAQRQFSPQVRDGPCLHLHTCTAAKLR